ncbi:hypothetical protein SVAN01_01773 [Stagonosporopsis vannaccii]|nr:hypothetical protein SVAN01_01773 [Stagonosporopsis vannaccii]
MEMDIRSELSAELTRITQCPYPASLSNLEHLLSRADAVIIRCCIYERPPCEVTKLAALICEALPLWAYTSRVLQLLCCSSEFTEKLLLHSPGLLNALLTKAISSQRDFNDYLGLCVQLLSRPLPEFVPLPASAQSFFLLVFERATQNPDVSTLKPVYSMLNGACRKLLNLLPPEVRQQFDRELCHILSSNGTGLNSMLLLWCFGIIILAEHPEEFADSAFCEVARPDWTGGVETQWRTASGRKLFGSPNGLHKTINLTYLSVIWATKGDVGVSDLEAIEGIRIAIRTLRFVDTEARVGWPNSSALAKNIYPKLPAKILRGNIHPTVQLEGLCFYSMIAGAGNMPAGVAGQYQGSLARIEELADAEHLHEILMVSLPVFAPQMQHDLIEALLSEIIEACVAKSAPRSLQNLVILVDTLSVTSSSCAPLRFKLLSALSSPTLQDKAWNLIRKDAAFLEAGCRTYAASLHREAIAGTISLILSLVISSRSAEPILPQPLAAALITKQRKLSQVSGQCFHATSTSSGHPISLFQQESTPFTGQHLQDWRDRLKSELESQNFYQRDSIIRSVAQICQDLETRCNTVEEPLRRERLKSQQLEQRIEELNEQVSSLESQAADDRFHLDGLEDEKMALADERDRISTRLDELRVQFEEANRGADEALRSAQEAFNMKELELRSTILNHEEQFRTREDEIKELNATLGQVRESLEHAEEEFRASCEQYDDLQTRFADTSRQLDDEREAKSRQFEEVLRLKGRAVNLEHQLQSAESELEAVTEQLGDLEVGHQELKQSSEDALREMEVRYKTDLEAAATRENAECNKLHIKLSDVVQSSRQLKHEYDKATKELDALQITLSTLEIKAQELDMLCGEQEEELEELRALRRNVLASMGLATQNSITHRSASRSQKDGLIPETPRGPREHRRRKSALQTQDSAPKATATGQNLTDTVQEKVTEASAVVSGHESQDGSTPKRQKPRPSFKEPTMQTPLEQRPILASCSTSKRLSPVKRSALRQMSPNRRHTTVGFALSETDSSSQAQEAGSATNRRESHRGPSQEDFDMDDFLAGTPLTPGAFASGTGRVPEDDASITTEL